MPDTDTESTLAVKFARLLPHLNERQRRLAVAAEAAALGRGGVSVVARASGLSRPTVYKGLAELGKSPLEAGRARTPGGGRKPVTQTDPGLVEALEALIDPASRGDPGSQLRWTTKSTRSLAAALTAAGHQVSRMRVCELLHQMRYSLQSNAKVREGASHPDRDAQFRYINRRVTTYLRRHEPVISVDTKKKELVGDYKNPGRTWRPTGEPVEVNVHDFPDEDVEKAIPYGVYDVGRNRGWVEVGVDHDTAAFAVAAIRAWWYGDGTLAYPKAKRLLVTADSGGSNSYRSRLWKKQLGALAQETGLAITVCHFPPGTSKWNKIEHRLFSQISTNWRGQPLTSHEVAVNLIGATTIRGGLTVHAELDPNRYPEGVKVTDRELASLRIKRHKFHGEWNYTVQPTQRKTPQV
jgi:Rhodopirellula transposase DDE domain